MADVHAFNLPGDTPHYAPDRRWRAEHLRLELAVDPDHGRIEGTATYTLAPAAFAEPEAPEIVLDAAEMEILDVSPAQSWTYDEATLRVQPEGPGPLTLAIRYAAEPSKGMYFLQPDEAYPNRPRQIWTQCQAEDARYWIPSFDFPNQKLTTELIATVPEGLTVVSNGRLEYSAEAPDNTRRWHFKQEVPHPAYLMTLAAGQFSHIEDQWREVPVSYFVEPG